MHDQGCHDYKVGDRVRLLESIWDDGADHHPAGYLAHKGEILFVRKLPPETTFDLCVSHEGRLDNCFGVSLNEVEPA